MGEGARTVELLAVAISAAERGGEVLRRFFGELKPSQIDEKSTNDWVSAADHASEEAVVSFLRGHTPSFGILGEERGASGDAQRRWVIDPLDGTANFVRGFPHFAVSVALMVGDDIEVGAIYDPMRDEMFAAGRGCGATRDGVRLAVTGRETLRGAFVTTGFPFRVHRHIDTYLAVFRDVFLTAGALRRPGAAALDLAHTAAGIFDGFFEFCLSLWDIAAGACIVREAGGIVTDLDGGPDIGRHGNVVAATPAVHAQLLEIIQRHAREGDIVP